MTDLGSILVSIALLIALIISIIYIWKYYNQYSELKNDESTYVYLQDFEGHKKKIGKFYTFGLVENKFSIQVVNEEGFIDDWTIELESKYSFESISRNYKLKDEHKSEIMLLCNFYKTDFTHKKIVPLVNIEILKMGLSKGLKAIDDKTNPLYEQIEHLRQTLKKTETMLLEREIEYDNERLKYFNELKFKFKELLDEVLQELIYAPQYVKAKILKKRDEYLNSIPLPPPALDQNQSQLEDEPVNPKMKSIVEEKTE